jgi:hypothetical protein
MFQAGGSGVWDAGGWTSVSPERGAAGKLQTPSNLRPPGSGRVGQSDRSTSSGCARSHATISETTFSMSSRRVVTIS